MLKRKYFSYLSEYFPCFGGKLSQASREFHQAYDDQMLSCDHRHITSSSHNLRGLAGRPDKASGKHAKACHQSKENTLKGNKK